MSEAIITAEGLSKRYLVAHNAENQGHRRYIALRDVIGREIRNIARKSLDMMRGRQVLQGDEIEEFWALRDVNFEINRGEVVGIIGRNGAGKSTLLKILSRITDPTEGRVLLRGRVGSLLEVGTGFNAELTGRENIYLNGAILGMTRREIAKKFDEIVAFAEVERFLDTPVKRYSSGMYLRLGFAVAAHLEPDILIVDEVLAVGDTEFQQKCLGKMDQVSRQEGRTVLFVSHNLAAIAEMADRVLLLDSGSIAVDGSVAEALSVYFSRGAGETTYARPIDAHNDHPHIERVELQTSDPNGIHRFGEPLEIKFWIRHAQPMNRGCFCFQIFNQFQTAVIHSSYYHGDEFGKDEPGALLVCRFPRLLLNVGRYFLRTWLQEPPHDGEIYETLDGICAFEVVRIDQDQFAGWRSDVCTYHEQHVWTAINMSKDAQGLGGNDLTRRTSKPRFLANEKSNPFSSELGPKPGEKLARAELRHPHGLP
jgi:lipopolysaccharide transport system ATP-binding protein